MERASRVRPGHRKEIEWMMNSIHIPNISNTRDKCSESMNGFDKAKEKMDHILLLKNTFIEFFHENDERNSDFFTGTERR